MVFAAHPQTLRKSIGRAQPSLFPAHALTRRSCNAALAAVSLSRARRVMASAASGDLLVVGPGVLGGYLGKLWADGKLGSVTGQTNTTTNHPRFGLVCKVDAFSHTITSPSAQAAVPRHHARHERPGGRPTLSVRSVQRPPFRKRRLRRCGTPTDIPTFTQSGAPAQSMLAFRSNLRWTPGIAAARSSSLPACPCQQ
jgi:hypothetical protein